MHKGSISGSLDRIEAALERIEAAARQAAAAPSEADPDLANRHDALKTAVEAALVRIDALIGGAET